MCVLLFQREKVQRQQEYARQINQKNLEAPAKAPAARKPRVYDADQAESDDIIQRRKLVSRSYCRY